MRAASFQRAVDGIKVAEALAMKHRFPRDRFQIRRDHAGGGRRRADVPRLTGGTARPLRVLLIDHADGAGQEDPDFGRRALQLHQHPHRRRSLSFSQSAFRASRRWAAIPRRISSRWSIAMALPGTKRRWGSCSATGPRARSSRCWRANARSRRRDPGPRPSCHRHRASRRPVPRHHRWHRSHRSRAGAGDRRPLDPEDGRDRLCL
jgi:hypothetical protein